MPGAPTSSAADLYAPGMIIVTGSVQARPDQLADVLALSLEHVHRSRREPGCLVHSVHQDVEDPNRVVFVEQWADLDALRTHFQVPASGAFVTALAALTDGNPRLDIYDATPTSV
jgi:quinol monooxygenase YgiN